MKHVALFLIALSSAGLALAASNLLAADPPKLTPVAGDTPKVAAVVVDPTDFRQPIPDPELGLTDKYDGKVVRFSGVVRKSAIDKKANEHAAELQFDIVDRLKVKGKDTVVGKETIVISVTFLNPELALQQLFEKEQRAKGPGVHVTVQGKGSILLPEGTLVITDAVIVNKLEALAK
jgi:hypothetical protein